MSGEISIIKVGELDIKKIESSGNDYLCISDFVPKEGTAGSGITIIKWLSSKDTLSFLGLWEKLNNQNFNLTEFGNIKNSSGTNNFSISSKKWIEKTNAIGITSKAGRYNSGTYAHIDIAMEFASWLSPEFKLYLITEFQRLKKEEAIKNKELAEWDNYRWLSKINYRLHTDSIKENIIDKFNVPKLRQGIIYSNEANMLNQIIFGMTAKEFKNKNDNKDCREEATTEQLAVLSNLEILNASLINDKINERDRFIKLSEEADKQFNSFSKLKIPPRRNAPLFDKSSKKELEQENLKPQKSTLKNN